MNIIVDIPLATSQVGLDLRAALVTTGDTVDPVYRNLESFKNIAPSIYHWEYTIPDNFIGSIIFYTGTINNDVLLLNAITVKATMVVGGTIGGGQGETEVLT